MTDLNSAFKSIWDEIEEVKYGMTYVEAKADADEAYARELTNAKIDAFNEGFDDAYDLNPCEPISDIPECRTAYFEGYVQGIESWIKHEFPDLIKAN